MKLTALFNAQGKTSRELDAMREEICKDLGNCEQRRRHNCALLANVQRVQAQRRVRRNL